MHYTISIDDEHAIAEIRFVGDMPYEEHAEARCELLELCAGRHITKILIDARRLHTPPGPVEKLEFVESWPRHTGEPPILIAGVLPQDDAARKRWWFDEARARSQGYRTRTFDDIEAARAWLVRS